MFNSVLTQTLLLLTLFLGSGRHVHKTESVEMVELNHHHDYQTGKHSYDQIIFYEWSHDYTRYHVIAWGIVEKPEHFPTKDPRGYKCDFKGYTVYATSFRESWTVVDPERQNKKLFPDERRLGFRTGSNFR